MMNKGNLLLSLHIFAGIACHVEPEKIIDTAYEEAEVVTPPIETDHQLELGLPDCDPPLILNPEDLHVAPRTSLLMLAQGGTGNHRFSVEKTDVATIDSITGAISFIGENGEDTTITVTDTHCNGEATAMASIGQSLTVVPQTAFIPPLTAVFLEISTTIGPIECQFVQNESGGSLDECDYTAGQYDGIDILKVTDIGNEKTQNVYMQVDSNAELKLWNASLTLPIDSDYLIKSMGGSGHLELSEISSIVELNDMQLEAVSIGSETLNLIDPHTGQSIELTVEVTDYITHDLGIDGALYVKDVLKNAGDLDGDGYDDVFIGLPWGNLSAYRSGIVALYKGSEHGFNSEPWMVFGDNMAAKTYFGEDILVSDLNMDGLKDVIIIGQSSDIGGTNKGAAFIHMGRSGNLPFEENPLIITGKDRYDQLASVAACDINGDGLIDLALGSPYADDDSVLGDDGKNIGAINIHYRTPNGYNSEPDIQRFGRRLTEQGDWATTYYLEFGEHIAAGDLNGDGYCDLIAATARQGPIGTERNTTDESGMVGIFLGSEQGPSERPNKIIGLSIEDVNANFGHQLVTTDLDQDGNDELFIGAWRLDLSGGTNNGAVFGFNEIDFSDSTTLLDAMNADWRINGNSYEFFGAGLDIYNYNADNVKDIIVGAPYKNNYGTRDGSVLVFDGQGLLNALAPLDSIEAIAEFGYDGDQNWSRFGQKVAAIQDIDGDGLAEMAILHARFTSENDGIFDLELLATAMSTGSVHHMNYPGQGGGSYFGMDSALIDIDGDTILDLCIGAPKAGAKNEADTGVVIWLKGHSTGFETEGQTLAADVSVRSLGDEWGHTLNAESDIDGDGYKDLVIGALRDDVNSTTHIDDHFNSIIYESPEHQSVVKEFNTGNFFVFKGGPAGLETTPTFAFFPHKDAEVNHLTGGLDVNGDGYEDIVTGATNLGDGGGVMILWGRATPNPADIPQAIYSPTTLYAGDPNIKLGAETAAIGDLNQDGCDDFIVGVEEDSYIDRREGAIRIVWGWGGAACPNVATTSAIGIGNKDAEFGRSVSGNVDMNDDGFPDIAVGSTDYRGTAITEGGMWLLDGSLISGLSSEPLVDGVFPQATQTLYHNAADLLLTSPIISSAEEDGFASKVRLIDATEGGLVAISAPLGNYGAGSLSGGIQIHRYDPTLNQLMTEPEIIISGKSSDGRSEFGSRLKTTIGNGAQWLLIGAPLSDEAGPDVGAFMPIKLNP